MKKYTQSPLAILLLLLTILSVSCKEELIYEDPEPFYDKGERLKINNDLVILDDRELTHSGGQAGIWYDEASQVLKVDASTLEVELDTGLVLHIDREQDVLLRRISHVEQSNGEYILQTEDGHLLDVFDDAKLSFDFSPEFSNQQLKSGSMANLRGNALSKALTDDDQGIHPSEIRMIVGDTEQVIFSVEKNIPLLTTKSARSSNKVGFEHQFNTNKTILAVGPVELVLEDFGFSWYSDLKANFSTEKKYHHTPWGSKIKPPYYVGAKLDVIAEDMDIEAWFDVAAVIEGKLPLVNETDPLLLPMTLQFEFPVGTIPVLIGIEFALDLGVEISVDGKAKVGTGYTLKYNIPKVMVGGTLYEEYLIPHWSSRHDYQQGHVVDQHFHPLKLEAMASLKQVYTLKPTMGFSLYRLAGPEINLAIGTEFDFDVGGGVSLSLDDSQDPQAYIGWGGKLSTKVGAGGGVWFDAFGVLNKHLDIPTLPLLPSIPIWHTPESLSDKTGTDFGNTLVGQAKEVEVEVKDSWTLPAPMMFVEWVSDGGGHWEHPITMTALGVAKNKWIPTEAGTHHPYCYVKNGKLKEIGRVNFTTTTTEE